MSEESGDDASVMSVTDNNSLPKVTVMNSKGHFIHVLHDFNMIQ